MSGISAMAVGKKAMWAGSARTFALCVLAVLVAVSIGVLLATKPAHAKTFTVTNTNVSGAGTLEQAIINANANNNTSTIDAVKFNIPTNDPGFGLTTPGVFTISSTTALSQITEPLTIDGYSQPGSEPNTLALDNDAVLTIELRRTDPGVGTGLWINAKNTTIKGLVINGWEESVRISGSGSRANKVQGNFLGPDASGHQDPDGSFTSGSLFGVSIVEAPANTVGGTTPAARNVICVNVQSGVSISGTGATANKVMGNFIGTDASGTQDRGNSQSGVAIEGAPSNIVGGTTPAARNLISGNGYGIRIDGAGATANKIMGNYVGTKVNGTESLGNASGVIIEGASNNTVGGTTAGARNIISSSSANGVTINPGAVGNKVMGNYIGTRADGTEILPTSLGNSLDGVAIFGTHGNTIGGTTAGARNVISGNRNGVSIGGSPSNTDARANKVMGNFIGTDAAGTQDLPNSRSGVFVFDADDNTIGGTTAGARNVISGNRWGGVVISPGAQGNSILSNSINGNGLFGNEALGIDLGGFLEGVTANDGAGDGDTGPNNLQNFPVLSSAKKTGDKTTIKGTLNSTIIETFIVQFFSSPEADSSGNGEGKTFLGQKIITTDAGGDAAFSFAANAKKIPPGGVVSATATNQSTGDTSEFSKACTVPGAPCPP